MILDTNALSAWLDGDRALERHLASADRISLSPIALGEFRFGVLSSRHRGKYEERLRLVEEEFPPLSINGATAVRYAALRRELASKGRPIPWHDLWIAAQALQHRLPVLSRDEHFDVVPSLRRVSW
ncbi:MAG: PIN domain-containing protein [Verrucomicrobiota bacterium]|nr:PIN domain-containing protein [Verrucomicrobiota bacterium]MDQ6939608.1 PIN domain-containing protein [Verrucomicrobiota bacterium]